MAKKPVKKNASPKKKPASKKTVTFTAVKTKKVPTKVQFKTKDGKTVKFKATTTKKVPTKVSFKAKKK